jgi:hypothetical protein
MDAYSPEARAEGEICEQHSRITLKGCPEQASAANRDAHNASERLTCRAVFEIEHLSGERKAKYRLLFIHLFSSNAA